MTGAQPTRNRMTGALRRVFGGHPRLAALVIAVFAIGLLAGASLLLAAYPAFYGGFDNMQAPATAWKASSHRAVSCYKCHIEPGLIPRTAYRVRAFGDLVTSLVPGVTDSGAFAAPTNAACLDCHSDLRTVSPKGDLQIPHKAHVNVLKMKCVQCHDVHMVHEPGPEGENSPPMEGCLVCHDGDTAENTCTACHTEKAAPDSHRAAEWVIVHPDERSAECEECHAWVDNWCVDCHSRRPRSHGVDWRATHRDRVEVHRSCEACHVGDFCYRCHGEVPQKNFDPDLKLVQ